MVACVVIVHVVNEVNKLIFLQCIILPRLTRTFGKFSVLVWNVKNAFRAMLFIALFKFLKDCDSELLVFDW